MRCALMLSSSSGKFRKSMPTVSVAQSNSPASPRLIPIELPLPMIRSASADTLIPKKSGSAELPRTEPVAKVVSHSSTFSDSTLIEVPRVPAQSSVTGAHEAATRRWDGGFRNPWPSAQGSTIKDLLNKPFERSRAFSESVRAQGERWRDSCQTYYRAPCSIELIVRNYWSHQLYS